MKAKKISLDNIIFYALCATPLLIFIILGTKLLALVYNYSSPDFGSWPDWLSLITNIFIAFFTLVVAKNAKDFFSEKIHAEGLNRASILMDDIDNAYKKYTTLAIKLRFDANRFFASLRNENIARDHYERVIENAASTLEEISSLKSDMANITTSLMLLSRWSIKSRQHETFELFINTVHKSLSVMFETSSFIAYTKKPKELSVSRRFRQQLKLNQELREKIEKIYTQIGPTPLHILFSASGKA